MKNRPTGWFVGWLVGLLVGLLVGYYFLGQTRAERVGVTVPLKIGKQRRHETIGRFGKPKNRQQAARARAPNSNNIGSSSSSSSKVYVRNTNKVTHTLWHTLIRQYGGAVYYTSRIRNRSGTTLPSPLINFTSHVPPSSVLRIYRILREVKRASSSSTLFGYGCGKKRLGE
ncbi:hypothetical protein M0802_002026 [Mischocyttarus mexicanus]|nr:hypothetical protein M0802_002026 [Mischocyttarus mexicanus]